MAKQTSLKNIFDLTGKVALVTGGAGGLGKATALGLATFGANVAVTSRNIENLRKVAEEINGMGRESAAISADVTKEELIQVRPVGRCSSSEASSIWV